MSPARSFRLCTNAQHDFSAQQRFQPGTRLCVAEVSMSFVSDCRQAFRALRRTPAYALTAVVTLALGMGANAAIFSVADAVLFKPLPYPEPGRLVAVAELPPSGARNTVAAATFFAWQESVRSFAGLAARQSISIVVTGGGEPEELRGARVSTSYFDVLGVGPVIGRSFGVADGRPGSPCVVILSDRLWARRWGRSRELVGQSIRLNDAPCQVIGVLAPDSVFDRLPSQAYVPITFDKTTAPRGHFLTVVGRLTPEASLAQADAEVRGVSTALAAATPYKAGWTAVVDPLRSIVIRADSRRQVLVLFGAVGVLLLVACVNVAGLSLSRASVQRREVSIRLALGAGTRRLFAHFIAESLLVVTAGAVAGLLLGQWLLSAFTALVPAGMLPTEVAIALDSRVLLFTLGLVTIVSLIFGSVPAWQSLRNRASEALRSEGRGVTASRGARRMQNGLLVAQVALAMVLVAAASMLAVSFLRLSRVDPGFSPHNVMTFRVPMPQATPTDADVTQFHARMLEELRRIPQAASVGASASLPLRGWLFGTTVRVDGIPLADQARANAHVQPVVGDYFSALGIAVKSGRAFTDADAVSTRRVAVVNETFVRRFIGDRPAVGLNVFLGIGNDGKGGPLPTWEIVGVISDVKTGNLADAELLTPEVYVPHSQNPAPTLAYAVRARGSDSPVPVTAIRDAVRAVNPDLPLGAMMTMDALIGDSVVLPRFRTWLVIGFAGVTLIVAAIGVYAVRVQAVTARRKEMGIRLALGATRTQVMAMMVRQGAVPLAIGLAIGLACARLAAGSIKYWLFGVSVSDFGPLAVAALILGSAALLASWIPARRASHVEPLETLRQD
jgi:putative ABC transport system permease protein